MKLLKIRKVEGTLEIQTGLHIGAGKDVIEIGGTDSPVIKDALSGDPYIPGSSLKGKMRSLLEWKLGLVNEKGQPSQEEPVKRIFGSTDKEAKIGPTRIIVRDSSLNSNTKKLLLKRGIAQTEVKAENNINRITSEAVPRFMERTISGIKFDVEILYKIFDFEGDNGKTDEDNFQRVLESLLLVEMDALGGGGSRGNGKVKFDLVYKDGEQQPIKVDLSSIKI